MKKLSLLFAAIIATTMMFAQSIQLATLSHSGNITTFYGATALSQAHAAAVNGDVITLSSGSFNGVNITKAVTIRGAGNGMDTIPNMVPTIINSDFTINVPANDSTHLTLEGLYHNGTITLRGAKNILVLKCRLFDVVSSYSSDLGAIDGTFLHCKIHDYSAKGNASMINSVISAAYDASNFIFTNCIIFYAYVTNSTFYNCIIRFDENLESSNLAYNCVGEDLYSPSNNIFSDLPNNRSNTVVSLSTMFETPDIMSNTHEEGGIVIGDTEFFHLSAQGMNYLGNDGKQVGIHGGNMPFDPRTTIPQITRCNVAPKSTADGKLSVDIEVNVAE